MNAHIEDTSHASALLANVLVERFQGGVERVCRVFFRNRPRVKGIALVSKPAMYDNAPLPRILRAPHRADAVRQPGVKDGEPIHERRHLGQQRALFQTLARVEAPPVVEDFGVQDKSLPAREFARLPVREREHISKGAVPRIRVHTLFASIYVVRQPGLRDRVAP